MGRCAAHQRGRKAADSAADLGGRHERSAFDDKAVLCQNGKVECAFLSLRRLNLAASGRQRHNRQAVRHERAAHSI